MLERARRQIAARAPSVPPRYVRRLLVEKGGKEFFLPVEQLVMGSRPIAITSTCYAGREKLPPSAATLDHLARQLDPDQFARISRSELVNLDCIREMQPWFHGERRIILKDGVELTWTRRYRSSRN